MLIRLPLLLPLALCLARIKHLKSMVSLPEMFFLLAVGIGIVFLPVRGILKRYKSRKIIAGMILSLMLLTVFVFAPVLSFHSPNQQYPLPECRYLSPFSSHEGAFFPLGTDAFGRCVFSRLIYGSRVSLSIGFLAMILALAIGCSWGMLAGYAGGTVDAVMMRIVDGLLAFPRLFILILVVAVWPTPPTVIMVVIVLGCLSWMDVARLMRGQVLTLKEREYVKASRLMGASHLLVMTRHLFPNAMGPVIVDGTLRIGGTILVEAALSFLGLGVQPPTASWGNMIAGGKDVLMDAWWITTFPGLAIVLTVMTFFLMGEGLREQVESPR